MNASSLVIFLAAAILPSFLVALVATYGIRKNAARFGLIDKPNERKVHTTPTPLGGGLGIWLGVVSAFAAGQLALRLVMTRTDLASLVPGFAQPHLHGLAEQS